jgi:hypothetical protein
VRAPIVISHRSEIFARRRNLRDAKVNAATLFRLEVSGLHDRPPFLGFPQCCLAALLAVIASVTKTCEIATGF